MDRSGSGSGKLYAYPAHCGSPCSMEKRWLNLFFKSLRAHKHNSTDTTLPCNSTLYPACADSLTFPLILPGSACQDHVAPYSGASSQDQCVYFLITRNPFLFLGSQTKMSLMHAPPNILLMSRTAQALLPLQPPSHLPHNGPCVDFHDQHLGNPTARITTAKHVAGMFSRKHREGFFRAEPRREDT